MLRGRPAQCAQCRSLRETIPKVASTCGFDLATEVGARRTVQFLQSCQSRRVGWSLSCTLGLWKTERLGPDADLRMFSGESWAPWLLKDLRVPACGLLSRVMGVASRSHTAFPPADVSLELEAALPESSQSAPPSARVLQVGGLPWGFGEPVGDMLGRATLVTEDDVFRRDMGVHSRGGVSRVSISQFEKTTRLSPDVTSQSILETVHDPLLEIPN